jgi:hypothetical protein
LFEARILAADDLIQPATKLLLRTLERAQAVDLPVEVALTQSELAALQPSKYAHLQVIAEGALIAMDTQLYVGGETEANRRNNSPATLRRIMRVTPVLAAPMRTPLQSSRDADMGN